MRIPSLLLLAGIIAFSSCKKDDTIDPPEFKRSYLHILCGSNATTTGKLVFDYYNADDIVIENFNLLRSFPLSGYADMVASGNDVDQYGNGKFYMSYVSQAAINLPIDTIMTRKVFPLLENQNASLFLYDSAGTVTFTKVVDALPTDATLAHVRFANLRDGVGACSVTLNGTLGNNFIIPATPLGSVSAFVSIPEDDYDIQILDGNGSVLASYPSTFLYHNGKWNYFVGAAGSAGNYMY